MSWATSSGSPLEREVKDKAWTRVSTGPLLTPGSSSFWDVAEVRTLLGGSELIHIGVRCPYVEVQIPRYILGCVVFSCHMAPFGLPMRWGQAPSSAWPGDVAWVRRLHAIEEGTPDLGYRQHSTTKIIYRKRLSPISLSIPGPPGGYLLDAPSGGWSLGCGGLLRALFYL
jgi:hypothetical protein